MSRVQETLRGVWTRAGFRVVSMRLVILLFAGSSVLGSSWAVVVWLRPPEHSLNISLEEPLVNQATVYTFGPYQWHDPVTGFCFPITVATTCTGTTPESIEACNANHMLKVRKSLDTFPPAQPGECP